MVDKDFNFLGRGVKVQFPVVDIYYLDSLPVFNFTGIQLPSAATATSGVILFSTLDPLDSTLGIVGELNIASSGIERIISSAYSTEAEEIVTITGAESIHRKQQ